MANYVDAETQTVLSGLTRGDFVRPEFLFTAPDTTTPPDETLTEKQQPASPHFTPSQQPLPQKTSSGPSLLERRLNRPGLHAPISLPLDDEVPRSPPPTQAALSPLPVANKLHAGHTPLLPLSPVLDELEVIAQAAPEEDEDQSATPQQDTALEGPLTLPTNPVDGASDQNITLDALDGALSRLAMEQERFSRLKDAPEPTSSSPQAVHTVPTVPPTASSWSRSVTQSAQPTPDQASSDINLSLSRQGSADSRRSENQNVDGVILKSPPLNFGKPLGET